MRLFKKEEALNKFINDKNEINKLFQEDINKGGYKMFYVCPIDYIFKKMGMINRNKEPNNFYEFWTSSQKLNFFIDYDDKKYNEKKELKYELNIKKIIMYVYEYLKNNKEINFKCDEKSFYNNTIVLKSDLDKDNKKFSYHIIFKSIICKNINTCKLLYEKLKNNISKEHKFFTNVDPCVYRNTALRLCYNKKCGKNNTLQPITLNIKYPCTYFNNIQFINIKIKNNNAKLKYETNNEYKTIDKYDFFCKTLITQLSNDIDIFSYEEDKILYEEQIIGNDNIIESEFTNDESELNHMVSSLPIEYSGDYEKWNSIGMIIYNEYKKKTNNMNNIEKKENEKVFFEIWNNFSKKDIKKYSLKECKKKWPSFENVYNSVETKKLLTIRTLMKWCKDEKINLYGIKIKNNVNNYDGKYMNNDITQNLFLNKKKDNILKLNKNKLIPEDFKEISNKKLYCVKSEKGTGKTFNLIKYIFDNNIDINAKTSMLFVSSRRTFGAKLLGDLDNYGFKLYSDISAHLINEKRIICQADSIHRLNLDSYDYVFVDESESFLRYITCEHFKNNQKSARNRDLFEIKINDAKKIIVMDADLSDKSLIYFKSILSEYNKNFGNEDIFIMINEYKYYQDYEVSYMEYYTWINLIKSKISENKRLVIPMSSNERAKDLNIIITKEYPNKKVLLINKDTSNNNKIKQLINVNSTWIQYDIIIYTPTVCMGISFDVENHFDYIFAYGCHYSLCSLEFLQMMHRVRHPINKQIYLSIDRYKAFNFDDDIYSIDKVERIITNDYYLVKYNLNNTFLHPKIVKNKYYLNDPELLPNENVIYYKSRGDPIFNLVLNNIKERLENNSNFAYQLMTHFKLKGYKLTYIETIDIDIQKEIKKDMKDINDERKTKEKEKVLTGILKAENISQDEYLTLINNKSEDMNEKDMFKINKYKFKNTFNVLNDDINRAFVEKYYDKDIMKCYHNLSMIINSPEQTTFDKLNIMRQKERFKYDLNYNNCFKDIFQKNSFSYYFYIINIIYILGFDINDLTIVINKDEFINNLFKTIEFCEKYKYEIGYKYNIQVKKFSLIKQTLTNKKKFINVLLKIIFDIKITCYLDFYYLKNKIDWSKIPRLEGVPHIIPKNIKMNDYITNWLIDNLCEFIY